MLINKKFNAFMDSRNLGREIYERRIPKVYNLFQADITFYEKSTEISAESPL